MLQICALVCVRCLCSLTGSSCTCLQGLYFDPLKIIMEHLLSKDAEVQRHCLCICINILEHGVQGQGRDGSAEGGSAGLPHKQENTQECACSPRAMVVAT